MNIDITTLLKHPERTESVSGVREASEFPLDSESFRLEQPLEIDFTLRNVDGVIVADGEYRGTLTAICGRCLEPYQDPLDGQLEAQFFPTKEQLLQEKQATDEAIYMEPIVDGTVDLGSVIGQDILVQCPMRPLCEEDCEGLCPECGANRNETDCGHEGKSQDPRLSRIREIAEEMDEAGSESEPD